MSTSAKSANKLNTSSLGRFIVEIHQVASLAAKGQEELAAAGSSSQDIQVLK